MSDIEIVKGYIPGSIGRVVALHGTYYHKHWGFGSFFETRVATELTEFIGRYDEKRDGFWTVSLKDHVEGSITIDGVRAEDEGAHLRWFIMSDAWRGKGIGNRLINTAIEFCRSKDYKRVYLWSFDGLNAAKHLYQKAGFQLVQQHRGTHWGIEVTEQLFELWLK